MQLSKWVKRHRGWIAVIAILAVGGAAYAITRGAGHEEPATTYTTETASRGTLSVTVDGTGYLAVRDEVEVRPNVSGEIEGIEVQEGDEVDAGDVLYTLDDDSVRKEIASAKAARQQAYQSLSKSKLDLYRTKVSRDNLIERSESPSSSVSDSDIAIAKKEVAIAESAVDGAQDTYAQAKETYAEAVGALDDLEVLAPCDGIVWSVSAEAGDQVGTSSSSSTSGSSGGQGGTDAAAGTATTGSTSSAAVTIARDGQLGVELSINEVDITTIEPGQDAEVLFDAVTDLKMTGTVDEVAKEGSVSSGVVTYSVWLTLDGADKRLKTGMSASATIVTQVERDVVLVSNSAIKTATDGSSYVQVLADSAATPVNVTVETGAASATQTVITSGLEEGAKVVTKTVTSDSSEEESSGSDAQERGAGSGIMMMGGTGGPPAGGMPGGQ